MRDTVVSSRLVYTVIRQPEIYVYQLDTLLYEGYSCTRLQASGFSHQTAWNKPAHQLDTLLSILYVLFIWWRTVYLMTFCLSDDVLPYLMTFCLPDDVLFTWWRTALPDDVLFTWWRTALPDEVLFTWWRSVYLMTYCLTWCRSIYLMRYCFYLTSFYLPDEVLFLPDVIPFTWWGTVLPDVILFTWWRSVYLMTYCLTWWRSVYLMRCFFYLTSFYLPDEVCVRSCGRKPGDSEDCEQHIRSVCHLFMPSVWDKHR